MGLGEAAAWKATTQRRAVMVKSLYIPSEKISWEALEYMLEGLLACFEVTIWGFE
jgi:hypothetical protein